LRFEGKKGKKKARRSIISSRKKKKRQIDHLAERKKKKREAGRDAEAGTSSLLLREGKRKYRSKRGKEKSHPSFPKNGRKSGERWNPYRATVSSIS